MTRVTQQTLTAFAVSLTLLCTAGAQFAHAKKPVPKPGTVSTAITPAIVDALAEEIERAMVSLHVPGAAKPYLIRYKLTEVEVNDVVASLGSATSKKERHFVNLEANVHVGDYSLDNSNFAIPQAGSVDGTSAGTLPLEPSPRIARRAAWLASDRAYKEALAQLNAKKQFRAGGGAAARVGVPSYTKASKAIVQDKPVLVPVLESVDSLEKRADRISASLRGQRHVRNSRVAFTSFLERRWYITSEGTSVHDTRRVSGVVIVAHGQAADGQELSVYYARYGETAADLPKDAELLKQAKRLSAEIAALEKAPMAEAYTGPVMFEGRGATDIVRYSLAPQLGGSPVPEGLEKSQARKYGGAFADRIGRGRVLSPMLSVTDDPTARRRGRTALIGGYRFDDEGTPAQRVDVIKQGKLLTLLMGRTPAKTLRTSNGHARRGAPAGGYHGSATNVFINAKRGLGTRALRKKLIAQVKSEGLPYGMIIRQLDDAAITAAPERTRREMLTLINAADVSAPPPVNIAYRIYPNGRLELVRGVALAPVDMRSWKDIAATSKKVTTVNLLASESPNLLFQLRGIEPGFVPSAGVESSITTPDLLFKELDLKTSSTGRRDMPLVPPPSPASAN